VTTPRRRPKPRRRHTDIDWRSDLPYFLQYGGMVIGGAHIVLVGAGQMVVSQPILGFCGALLLAPKAFKANERQKEDDEEGS
jgi:hypothetical protein